MNIYKEREIWESYYLEPHRFYHTVEHIDYMMDYLDAIKYTASNELIAAICLHDAVYIPKFDMNEEASCELAKQMLMNYELNTDTVCKLILCTKHHIGYDFESKLLCDLDLAILGESRATYLAYRRKIRLEYSYLTNKIFKIGTRKFATTVISRDTIYSTKYFTQLEYQARSNLIEELK